MPDYREDAYRDKIKEQVLKLDSIDNLKPISNSVLVLIEEMHDEITHGTLTLKLDTSFEAGKHAPNKGTVIKVPDKLVFPKNKSSANDSDWETTIEIRENDLVFFDYLSGIECSKIEYNKNLYYILPYHALYVVKRGKQVIPLNGYILLSPIMYVDKYISFELEREHAKYATVAYAGSCNKRYRPSQNKMGKIFYHDDPAVQAGCNVIYTMPVNIWLEQEEHSSFDGDKRYRVTQRRFLSGITEEVID